MSEIAKRLQERRNQLVAEERALIDAVTEESRDFTAEETGRLQAVDDQIKRLDERLAGVLDQEQRSKDADDAFDKLSGKAVVKRGDDGTDAETELRKFVNGQGGRYFDVTPQGRVDFRVLSKLTAGAGGNTVPTSFYDRLMAHLIESSAVLQAGPTVLNTSGGENIQVPKTTAHSTGAIVTEGGTIAASDPAFGQVSLGAYKYGCLIQVSRELLADTGVDLEGYLSMQAGRGIGNAFGTHMVTGTGTGQPTGIVTAATTGITGGTGVAGAFTADNLIDLYFSVIAPYRNSPSAAWLLKDSSISTLRKIKDTTGQYIWQPGLIAGVQDSLLGKPIYTDPNVATVALGAASVVFGDISQYFVRMAGGVRFERSDDFAFNTDLVTFRCLLRGDATLVDLTGAVKKFVGNAA